MIENFRHRGLKRLYERGVVRDFRADQAPKIRRILARLDVVTEPEQMDLPGYGLHPLTGNFLGFWSVTVSRNWRVIFRFEQGSARDVDFIDYHQKERPMAMHNPPHPGELVRHDCLEPLGLSVTAAAEVLGVTRQALNNLVNGKAGISAEMAIRLDKAFGGGAETWLRMQTAYDLFQARQKSGTDQR